MSEATSEQAIRVNVSVWLPAGARSDAPAPDAARHLEAPRGARDAGRNGYDPGFEDGAAAGCALGRCPEALRWPEELERRRRLVHWAARQRDAA